MKKISSILSLLVFNLMFSQNIVGIWHTNELPWNKAEKEYSLQKLDKENPYRYGNFITLNENNTFEAYYSAPCGNDCFPTSKGTFQVIENNKIILIVNYIEQSGFCNETFKKKGNWSLGTYKIVKTDDGFRLEK